MASFSFLELEVIRWAESRGILDKSTPQAQIWKTAEELAELGKAINAGDLLATKDGVGDVVVTLIILCELLNIDLCTCLNEVLQIISKRKGKMVNGLFVKETI